MSCEIEVMSFFSNKLTYITPVSNNLLFQKRRIRWLFLYCCLDNCQPRTYNRDTMANAQAMIRQVRGWCPPLCHSSPRFTAGLPGDAAGDAGLHVRLCHHHPGGPAGGRVPLPALLQPSPHHQAVAALEDRHDLPLLWNIWLQFSVQYDLHLSLLPYVGGGKLQREIIRLCDDVYIRGFGND